MVPNLLTADTFIDAPIDDAWAILTLPENIRDWFELESITADMRPGGDIRFHWTEHGTIHARVEAFDRPRRFSFRWALVAGEPIREGNSTLVEFTLVAEGQGTRLRVVETGFATLDGGEAAQRTHIEQNTSGWAGTFDGIERFVASRAAV